MKACYFTLIPLNVSSIHAMMNWIDIEILLSHYTNRLVFVYFNPRLYISDKTNLNITKNAWKHVFKIRFNKLTLSY